MEDLLVGLDEFREHLGGELTIMLLRAIGAGEEVHVMKEQVVEQSAALLGRYSKRFSTTAVGRGATLGA